MTNKEMVTGAAVLLLSIGVIVLFAYLMGPLSGTDLNRVLLVFGPVGAVIFFIWVRGGSRLREHDKHSQAFRETVPRGKSYPALTALYWIGAGILALIWLMSKVNWR